MVYRLRDVTVTSLLTLTSRPSAHSSPDAAFTLMSTAVNILFKRIRRRWPAASIEYFLVWERTKAGWPHCHLLIRAPFIPQSWLSDQWADLTGAPVIDIRTIHQPDHVASYVAKYLSKDPQVPQGMKRYRHSRLFFAHLVEPPPSTTAPATFWSLEKNLPLQVALQLRFHGFTIVAHPDNAYTAYPRGHPACPTLDSLSVMYPKEVIYA